MLYFVLLALQSLIVLIGWFIVHRARISLLDYKMFLNIKMSWGLCPSWQWFLMPRVGFSHAHTVHLRTKPMER
jgi:hypothetical protein